METRNVQAIGVSREHSPFSPLTIGRRIVGAYDVEVDILYCGICHSDLHAAQNEWGTTIYPLVPGHEIVGKIKSVGEHVTKFEIGDLAAIGCIVDSCKTCDYCKEGHEQFCEPGTTIVFNSPDKYLGGQTFGGFSESIVANQDYVLHLPKNLDPASAAPLLCAGITVYSPLKHWNAGPGKKVGIIGIGGLGHLAIKIAKALGAHVTVFTTSSLKSQDANRLGADQVVLSTDKQQMEQQSKLDLILDTVSARHNVNDYLDVLRVDGAMVLVGLPAELLAVGAFNLVNGRKSFSGSNIGGIAETQEMLEFCARQKITADIELISTRQINQAFERLEQGDVHYRFVIDMSTLGN